MERPRSRAADCYRDRGFLAHRPAAVAALARIFIEEIERLLGAAAGVTSDASAPAAARPRLGAISFLHRFGLAINHHVHLHVCATEGVFVPAADGAGCDARYCARPPFALERLSVSRGADGQIARIRYVLPRHKAAN